MVEVILSREYVVIKHAYTCTYTNTVDNTNHHSTLLVFHYEIQRFLCIYHPLPNHTVHFPYTKEVFVHLSSDSFKNLFCWAFRILWAIWLIST